MGFRRLLRLIQSSKQERRRAQGWGKCCRNELRKPCQSVQADEPFGVGDEAEAGAVGEASTTSVPPISMRIDESAGIGSPSERAITIQLGPTSMISKPSFASATASWKPAVGSADRSTWSVVGGSRVVGSVGSRSVAGIAPRAARLVHDRRPARPGEWPLALLYELLRHVERTLEHLFRDAVSGGNGRAEPFER